MGYQVYKRPEDPGGCQQPGISNPGSPIFRRMAKKQKIGSVKRFGARYGRGVKTRLGIIEKKQHASYKCPYCHEKKVRRLSPGIWLCRKCSSKFTARAYTAELTGTKAKVE